MGREGTAIVALEEGQGRGMGWCLDMTFSAYLRSEPGGIACADTDDPSDSDFSATL